MIEENQILISILGEKLIHEVELQKKAYEWQTAWITYTEVISPNETIVPVLVASEAEDPPTPLRCERGTPRQSSTLQIDESEKSVELTL